LLHVEQVELITSMCFTFTKTKSKKRGLSMRSRHLGTRVVNYLAVARDTIDRSKLVFQASLVSGSKLLVLLGDTITNCDIHTTQARVGVNTTVKASSA
jgi:hypothetical protein